MRHYIWGICASFFLSGSLYANAAQNESKSLLVPYKLPNSSYILINQSGEVLHPLTQTFDKVTYYPESKIWQATQEVYKQWGDKKTIHIDTFFDESGQIVEIKKDDLIIKKLDEKHFLKYSSEKKRYQLTDRDGNVIKQLDPRITNVDSYSSGLAVAEIYIGSDKRTPLYGYIDHKGEWVVQPKYKSAREFNGDFALVELGSKSFLIDKKSKTVFEQTPELSRYPLSNGYWVNVIAKNKGKWFSREILSPQNKVVVKNIDYRTLSKNLLLLSSKLKGEEDIGIFNTTTGEIIPYDGVTGSIGDYDYIRQDNDYTWLRGYHFNKWFYRLVDRNGDTIVEDDYQNVNPYFWGYGWVKPAEKNSNILIDSHGKAVTKPYEKIEIIQHGDHFYTIASNDQRHDFLSPKGELIAYTQSFEQVDDINCNYRTAGVYQSDGTLIWPKNIRQTCLISNRFDGSIAQKDKRDYFQAYVERLKQKNVQESLDDSSTVVHGPSTIDLANVAKLSLPQGYVWVQYDHLRSRNRCQLGYIIPEEKIGQNKWQICINVGDIGHVNSSSLNFTINNQHDLLQKRLAKTAGNPNYTVYISDFKWLKEPIFDNEQKTVVWGYELIEEYKNSAGFFASTSLIKFGKSNAVWLSSMFPSEVEETVHVIQDWGKRIHFNDEQSYELGEKFACNQLPDGDKSLEKMIPYLPSETRCFAYPVEILLTGLNYGNSRHYPNIGESALMTFINNITHVEKMDIERGLYYK